MKEELLNSHQRNKKDHKKTTMNNYTVTNWTL